jgi:protein-tyrosine phosphatase
MAHVDRYISPLITHGIPEKLLDLPVLVQANSNFFLSRFSRSMAMKMLKEGRIHCLGSDCHNTVTRPPNLGKTVALIKRSLGYGVMEDLYHWEAEIFHSASQSYQTLTPKDGV